MRESFRMDLTFNEHETEFRDALRAWLALNPPGGNPDGDGRDRYAWLRDWQRRLHEGGWAGVDWPVEYGGRGATLTPAVDDMFTIAPRPRCSITFSASRVQWKAP